MQEAEILSKLYAVYGVMWENGVNDEDIEKSIMAEITENCNKFDIGTLNDYCNLPTINKNLSDLTMSLIVKFSRQYESELNTKIAIEDNNKDQRKNKLLADFGGLIASLILIVLFLLAIHFDWFYLGTSFRNSEKWYEKAIFIIGIFGLGELLAQCFTVVVGAIGVMLVGSFFIHIEQNSIIFNILIILICAIILIAFIFFIYDLFKPIITIIKNKKLDNESENNKLKYANELNKKRKSIKQMISDGDVKVIDASDIKKWIFSNQSNKQADNYLNR